MQQIIFKLESSEIFQNNQKQETVQKEEAKNSNQNIEISYKFKI